MKCDKTVLLVKKGGNKMANELDNQRLQKLLRYQRGVSMYECCTCEHIFGVYYESVDDETDVSECPVCASTIDINNFKGDFDVKKDDPNKVVKLEEGLKLELHEVNNEIGNCSEIINLASKLKNSKLRNQIFHYVGNYRQELKYRTRKGEKNES